MLEFEGSCQRAVECIVMHDFLEGFWHLVVGSIATVCDSLRKSCFLIQQFGSLVFDAIDVYAW